MEKGEFFDLGFEEKLQFICRMRHEFSTANTNKEKEGATPQWLLEKARDLEGKHRFEDAGTLFLDCIVFDPAHGNNVEVTCFMDEIINDLLYLSILELEDVIGISWAGHSEEEYG